MAKKSHLFTGLVKDWCRARPVKGEVGVEIEIEGRNLPGDPPRGWRATTDGSLRGEALEYVFAGPKPRTEVNGLLDSLWRKFATNGSVLNESPRTSVHVHLNCQHLNIGEIYKIFCLHTILEDFLASYCGSERKGNLFCLRVRDAEYILDILRQAYRSNDMSSVFSDNMRYAALNLAAIQKYGSVEFRSMRGLTNADDIKKWVKILLELFDKALEYESPRRMVEDLSALGPEDFVKSVFSPTCFDWLNRSTQYTYDQFADCLYEGARLVQAIAYEIHSDFMNGLKHFDKLPVRELEDAPLLRIDTETAPYTRNQIVEIHGRTGSESERTRIAQIYALYYEEYVPSFAGEGVGVAVEATIPTAEEVGRFGDAVNPFIRGSRISTPYFDNVRPTVAVSTDGTANSPWVMSTAYTTSDEEI